MVLACALAMASCSHRHSVVWNDDGKTMRNLAVLRLRNRPAVELDRGVSLYADTVQYDDKKHRSGEAAGRVFLDVAPDSRHVWLPRYGYAGRAIFNLKRSSVTLMDMPMVEWREMIQIATNKTTSITIHWSHVVTDVFVNGPTRADFSKSYPLPAGVIIMPSLSGTAIAKTSAVRNVFLKP